MKQKIIELNEDSRIIIKNIGGDLTLAGWNRSEMQVHGCAKEDDIKQENNVISFHCAGDGILRLPHNVPVEVQKVGGDATAKDLDNPLTLNTVGGDLILRNVNAVTAKVVGGDISAKHTQGDLVVEKIGGDAMLRDLGGQFAATVGGDLSLRDISGGIDTTTGKDASVTFSPVPWQAYSIQAGGDIFAQIPQDTNAEFELKSGSKKIHINLKDAGHTIKEKTHNLTLGEGGPSVSLSAGGEIALSNEKRTTDSAAGFGTPNFGAFDNMENMFDEIAQQTTAQLEEQLSMIEEHLNTQFSDLEKSFKLAGLSEEKAQEVQERITNAQQRAQHSVQKAQAKLQRKLTQTQRKAARRARHDKRKSAEFDIESLLAKKEKASRAVSDKERMMILKMLQEKKITTDQANDLLSALEAKG